MASAARASASTSSTSTATDLVQVTGDALVTVGRIGKAHGLRGEVSVEPWTDDPEERFRVGVRFTIAAGPALTVAHARAHSGRWVIGFVGVEDRTAAEALRGTELLLPASARPAIEDPDEFYDSDLIGLAARTVGGAALGPVTDVVHGPGGDYLVLTIEGTERLVPFVAGIVPNVDLAAGVAEIDPPEGLFDL
jgi:16S rRNA processing protein RimM